MKNLVMAAVLGLLLVGANAPAEASTMDAAIGSQVEVVEVMHRPHHPPQRHHDFGGDYGERGGRRCGGSRGLNPPSPPKPKPGCSGLRHGGRGGHQPHFPGGRRW